MIEMVNILVYALYSVAKILGTELGICLRRGVSQHEQGVINPACQKLSRAPKGRGSNKTLSNYGGALVT